MAPDPLLPTVYVAGPLFDEGERWWIEKVEALISGLGFTTFLASGQPAEGRIQHALDLRQ